jgi:8-oxo-dGTP diphosphatase
MDNIKPAFIKIAALLLDNQGRLLILRDKGEDFFKALGGKVDGEESDEDCLRREIKEEVMSELKSARFLMELPLIEAHNKPGVFMTFKMYVVEVEGTPMANPEDKTEELLWLSKADFESGKYNIALALIQYAIPRLIAEGLMK